MGAVRRHFREHATHDRHSSLDAMVQSQGWLFFSKVLSISYSIFTPFFGVKSFLTSSFFNTCTKHHFRRRLLPSLQVSRSHALSGDPNPFNGFPSHFKFFLLRHWGNMYLKYGSGALAHRHCESEGMGPSGALVHANRDENALAKSICAVVTDLLSFGFQSSHVKLKELIPSLVSFLDGRTDGEM